MRHSLGPTFVVTSEKNCPVADHYFEDWTLARWVARRSSYDVEMTVGGHDVVAVVTGCPPSLRQRKAVVMVPQLSFTI